MNQITRDHDWWARKKCLAAGRLVVGGSYLRGCVVRVPRGWRGTDCDGALRGQIDREVKARFPARAVRQVALLQLGDDPVIEPGHLLARVFVEAAGGLQDYQRSLDGWAQAHMAGMSRLRRELSMRHSLARLPESIIDDTSAPRTTARITTPDDPELTGEPIGRAGDRGNRSGGARGACCRLPCPDPSPTKRRAALA